MEYKIGGLTNGARIQAPEIQTMYTLNMPVSTIRTKMRQEFERHRYVTKLKTVDVLIYKSHAEFQVRTLRLAERTTCEWRKARSDTIRTL